MTKRTTYTKGVIGDGAGSNSGGGGECARIIKGSGRVDEGFLVDLSGREQQRGSTR